MSLNFAIIGCGNIGQRHAELIRAVGRLAAVCDIDKEKASMLGKANQAEIYFSIDELLANEKNLDVVVICTPNGLHASQSIKSLQAGCHVLCEKPMAIKSSDCILMIEAADRSRKKLFIVKQNRFNPPVIAVKQLIEEGRLGKIFSVQLNCFWHRDAKYYQEPWRGTKAMDGGILFTQFSHFIDLLYWLIGDVKQVKSVMKNFAHKDCTEFEDTGVAILEFEQKGSIGDSSVIGSLNFTINSFQKNMEGSLTIFAEKGTVKIGGEYLNELEYQELDGKKIVSLPEGNKANEYGHYNGSMSNHDKVYQNLLDVLANKASISASSYAGLKTVEIIEKIYSSVSSD